MTMLRERTHYLDKLEEESKMATATMVPNPALMVHRVSAGPYTLELPTNGVAILYTDGEQLPGGVGYLDALVQFAGEVIRLREIAARPSPELHALTKERDEARDQILELRSTAERRLSMVQDANRCIEEAQALLVAVRDEALEEAARLCERVPGDPKYGDFFAAAIRALKERRDE